MAVRKLAIVGWALSSRDRAPFGDSTFEVWGCNEIGRVLPGRYTAHFQLHRFETLKPDQVDWLRRRLEPVHLIERRAEIPASVAYPLDSVVARFGRYFASTPAYMMALGILQAFERIELYGVDMGSWRKRLANPDRHGYQRANMEYLIGFARGRGIDVWVPDESALLKRERLYGFED